MSVLCIEALVKTLVLLGYASCYKLAHWGEWVNLLGQSLSRNHVFKISGEYPPLPLKQENNSKKRTFVSIFTFFGVTVTN